MCSGSYLDYTAMVVHNPVGVTVSDSFFLGMGNLVVRAEPTCRPADMHNTARRCDQSLGEIDGFVVTGNTWKNGGRMPANATVVVDERGRRFGTVRDLVMSGNLPDLAPSRGNAAVPLMAPKAVRATKTLRLQAAKRWDFDFSAALLFDSIAEVRYSITIEGGAFARHAARPADGLTVAVETDVAVTATVTLTAIQGEYSIGNQF